MKIIYYDYGGAHSTVTLAHIHLGVLPTDRRPGVGAIMHQPHFDQAANSDLGKVRPMGTDAQGNEVYVCGLGGGRTAMVPALLTFLELSGADPSQVQFVDTMPTVNLLMRLGGYTSRVLHIVWLGRPLVAFGAWLAYPKQRRLVAQVRASLT